MKIQISLSKKDHAWWDKKSLKEQEAYLKDHPESVMKLNADKPTAKKSSDEPLGKGRPLADYAAEKDDAGVTEDKIFSQFSEEDVAEMKQRFEDLQKLPSTHDSPPYVEKGEYSEDRKKLHDAIVAKVLSDSAIKAATPKAGEKPTFIVLGGRGGSGKSAFTHDEETGEHPKVDEFDSRKFLVMDADKIKGMLKPPYKGWNANQVHEESSYLFDKIVDAATKMGLNIISDATLKSDKMGPQLEAMSKSGYQIEGHYMFLPRQKAASRAVGRYLKDGKHNRGRLVPPAVILGNTKNEANFDKLKPFFSKWSCYDNDQPKGQPPKLIDRGSLKSESRSSTMRTVISTSAQSTKFNLDTLENDPYLTANPKRAALVERESFLTLKRLGIKPERVVDLKVRKLYAEWLKSAK